jgi:tol-pal system protein YbgF
MRKHGARKALCVISAIILLGACAPKSDVDALQSRVRHQDQQLQQLQPIQADTWAQMQAIRQDLASLHGQLDELQSAGGARALADKVNRHDAALRQVESALALNFQLDAPSGAYAPGLGAYNNPDGRIPAMEPEAGEPGGIPTAATAPPPPPKDTGTALYDAGMGSYNSRNYQEALRSFADFTKNYPAHKLAGPAWFWTGESNFQLNRFADAALAYDTVITKYGNTQKASAAYLKQGIAFSKLGQKEAANARLKELIRKFPNSAEATRAKQILQQNR